MLRVITKYTLGVKWWWLIVVTLCNQVNAYEIDVLEECDEALTYTPVHTVLDSRVNTLSGWNHADTDSDEFSMLTGHTTDYDISDKTYLSNPSCDGGKTQNSVLAVKLSDWTRQHVNGFETSMGDEHIAIQDISHVVIDLNIVSQQTRILGKHSLEQHYGQLLTAAQLSELDSGKVNIAITLFEAGALDQSSRSLNAETIVEIDQTQLADRWLRISIPLTDFTFYYQQNYNHEPVKKAYVESRMVAGMRINLETANGKQLRNILGGKWSTTIPETFKEVGLQLRRIELLKL